MPIKFQKKKTFYPFPVYEFNLPAGHSCPFARDCKGMADRKTGKFTRLGKKYRCYAVNAERFPGVRESRWRNFEAMLNHEPIEIPKDATHIRIHSSGDFFSQDYFDKWLEVCRQNPNVKFWAFTKSIGFWVRRLDKVPSNLTLQASKGSHQDHLIDKYNLKYAEVFLDIKDVPKGMPIDTDDSHAMEGNQSFALLDNFSYSKKDKNV
jgi:hypothetical protein